MKIVHVLPALTKGGAERVALDLANWSAAAGNFVTIVAAFQVDENILEFMLNKDIPIKYIGGKYNNIVIRYIKSFYWVIRNKKWLYEQDIIHCHLTFGSVIGTLVHLILAATGRRLPVVIETYHAVGMPISPFVRWVHAILARRRDGFVLIARDDYWDRHLARQGKTITKIIPNGLAVAREIPEGAAGRKAYRADLGMPETCTLVVGTVGRMRPDRQPWLFVPIFIRISNALGPNIHFLMAGDGPAMGTLRVAIREAGLEGRVHLPGMVLSALRPISIMDLYISMNVGAITGIAGLEAAFSEVPIVGIQLLEGYKAGAEDWIWSSADLEEVADHVIDLLKRPQQRRELARKQTTYANAHFGIESSGNEYRKIYENALNLAGK